MGRHRLHHHNSSIVFLILPLTHLRLPSPPFYFDAHTPTTHRADKTSWGTNSFQRQRTDRRRSAGPATPDLCCGLQDNTHTAAAWWCLVIRHMFLTECTSKLCWIPKPTATSTPSAAAGLHGHEDDTDETFKTIYMSRNSHLLLPSLIF